MPGAIAAGHPLTAEAGARVLAEGGNAVDACIAAASVAFVTEGPLTGPAGGGFFLIHEAGRATTATVLDCFFAVPARTLGAMEEVVIDFADAGTQTFHVGDGSVAVPGLVQGLEDAHRRYASLPWAELLEPAVALAHEGFPRDEAREFLHGILVPILQRTEDGRRVYGDPAHVRTEELVGTLESLRDRGAAAVAELLPEFAGDLAAYRVSEREPIETRFRGCEVLTTPAPSRGGAIVAHILEQLDTAGEVDLTALVGVIGKGYEAPATTPRLTGTTHLSVVDGDGMAAALSTTLGSGSGVFRGGTQLNNMLGEFDVIGEDERAPGMRLPSMMTPTLVLEAGRPRLVLGSAGSVRLAGAIAQVVWRVLGGSSVAEAIAAPRVHPDGPTAHVEGGWPDDAVAALEARDAWEVVRWSGRNLFFGGVSAVGATRGGSRAAAGDPRRGGHGIVVP